MHFPENVNDILCAFYFSEVGSMNKYSFTVWGNGLFKMLLFCLAKTFEVYKIWNYCDFTVNRKVFICLPLKVFRHCRDAIGLIDRERDYRRIGGIFSNQRYIRSMKRGNIREVNPVRL